MDPVIKNANFLKAKCVTMKSLKYRTEKEMCRCVKRVLQQLLSEKYSECSTCFTRCIYSLFPGTSIDAELVTCPSHN